MPFRGRLPVVLPVVATLVLAAVVVLLVGHRSAAVGKPPAEAVRRVAVLDAELRAATAGLPGVELTGVEQQACDDGDGPTVVDATLLTRTPARTLDQLRARLQARGWTLAAPGTAHTEDPAETVFGESRLGPAEHRWAARISAGSHYPDAADVTLAADELLCD